MDGKVDKLPTTSEFVARFKRKYPGTIGWRYLKNSEVVEKHLNPGEEVVYAFIAQKNDKLFQIFESAVVALTTERILIGRKRVLFGYFIDSITPEMFNDLKVSSGLIFGKVKIDTVKQHRVCRSAAGNLSGRSSKHIKDEGLGEILEHAVNTHDELELNRRRDHRDGNGPELTPSAGTVQASGFIKMLRNTSQGRQEDNGRTTASPATHYNQCWLCPVGIIQPGRAVDTDGAQHIVDDTVAGVHDPQEQQGTCHTGYHAGKIENCAEKRHALGLDVHDHGHDHSERKGDWQTNNYHVGGVGKALLDIRVCEELSIVFQADPLGRLKHIVLGKGVINCAADRIDFKQQESNNPGRSKGQTDPEESSCWLFLLGILGASVVDSGILPHPFMFRESQNGWGDPPPVGNDQDMRETDPVRS